MGDRNADKEMIKNGKKNIKSFNDIKELYRKAGVDSGYLMAINNMLYSHSMVKKKYATVIKNDPELFKKVIKELTSSAPKPPKLNLNSAH